jgi:hypothetical protein
MNGIEVSPYSLVLALASRYIVSWLRNASWFKYFDSNSVGKVHIVNGIISTILSTGAILFSGNIQEADVNTLLSVIFTGFISFLGAKGAYDLEKESK